MTCNLRHPLSLRHPVRRFCVVWLISFCLAYFFWHKYIYIYIYISYYIYIYTGDPPGGVSSLCLCLQTQHSCHRKKSLNGWKDAAAKLVWVYVCTHTYTHSHSHTHTHTNIHTFTNTRKCRALPAAEIFLLRLLWFGCFGFFVCGVFCVQSISAFFFWSG